MATLARLFFSVHMGNVNFSKYDSPSPPPQLFYVVTSKFSCTFSRQKSHALLTSSIRYLRVSFTDSKHSSVSFFFPERCGFLNMQKENNQIFLLCVMRTSRACLIVHATCLEKFFAANSITFASASDTAFPGTHALVGSFLLGSLTGFSCLTSAIRVQRNLHSLFFLMLDQNRDCFRFYNGFMTCI